MDPVEESIYKIAKQSDLTNDLNSDWSSQGSKLNLCRKLAESNGLEYYQMEWLKEKLRVYYKLPTIFRYDGIGVSVTMSTKSINGLVVGNASYIGRRQNMEDTHVISLSDKVSGSFVNDGHGGLYVSDFLADNLDPQKISTMTNRQVQIMFNEWQSERSWVKGGSCCTGAIYGISGPIRIINVGDSRTLVLKNSGEVVFATKDHKPTDPDEEKYIKEMGGTVEHKRVDGYLAVSRAFGDNEISSIKPKADFTYVKDGDIIVSVCDGITDVMSNEEIAKIVVSTPDATIGAGLLTWGAYKKGSGDNLSAVISRRVPVGMRYMADGTFFSNDITDSGADTEPAGFITPGGSLSPR